MSWVWAVLGFRFSAVSNENVVSIHKHNEVETLVIVLAACTGWFLDGHMTSICGPSNDPLEDRWEEIEERDITIARCHVSQVARKLDPEIQRPWTWLFIYIYSYTHSFAKVEITGCHIYLEVVTRNVTK